MLFSISFANKLFVLENIEKTNTHKNKTLLFIKKIIFLILQQKIFLVMNKLFHSLQVWGKMQPIDFKILDNLEKDFFNTNERS